MPRQSVPFFKLNQGEISKRALSRVDLEKLRMSAEEQINVQPQAIGAGTFRAGLGYLGSVYNNAAVKLIEFIYGTEDAALIELSDSLMRVWIDDALVTRPSVASTIQDLSLWSLNASLTASVVVDGSGLTISSVTKGNVSYAYGTMTISGGDMNTEHALRIVIAKGPILFKIGSASGGEDIFGETSLNEGTHSLAFTPGVTTAYVQFESHEKASRIVTSIAVESAGVMTLPTPWLAADLDAIKTDQSADVVVLAHGDHQQRRIERHREGDSVNSWSIVLYQTVDGPFPAIGGDESIQLAPNSINGDCTIVSNKNIFTTNDVGRLIRLFHITQSVKETLNAPDTWTKPIRVAGVYSASSTERTFQVDISGTWVGTITLQRTFDPEGLADWVDWKTYTTNQAALQVDDQFTSGVIVYYRLGFKPIGSATTSGSWSYIFGVWVYTGGSTYATGYTSGSAVCTLSYKGGAGPGVARIYGYTDEKTVSAEVLSDFSNTSATNNWRFSEWGGAATGSYPTAVTIHEGRLWWARAGKVFGSVSDAYTSYDFEAETDAGPIIRTIGKGPIAHINWLLSVSRLCLGSDAGVIPARSNSFDDPLTPSNFNLKYSSTHGADPLRAVAIDTKGVYVERSGRRVYGLEFSSQAFDYKLLDFTRLNLDIGIPGFVDISVQRQPDTMVRLVRSDGMLANFLFSPPDEEDLMCWWRIQTDGEIENVAVLPGPIEDKVYVVVKRTIDGNTVRYLEKFARLDECVGGTTNKLADSFVTYSGVATTTLTGLDHLEGEDVVVWADGLEVGFDADNPTTIATYTVTGGSITVPVEVEEAVIGLPYTGTFISAKLAYAAAEGTAMNQYKRVSHMGFMLDKTHYQGIRYGHKQTSAGEEYLTSLPRIERGKETPAGTVWDNYDQQMIPMKGKYDTDSRVKIEMRAPRPATVMGFVVELDTSG